MIYESINPKKPLGRHDLFYYRSRLMIFQWRFVLGANGAINSFYQSAVDPHSSAGQALSELGHGARAQPREEHADHDARLSPCVCVVSGSETRLIKLFLCPSYTHRHTSE